MQSKTLSLLFLKKDDQILLAMKKRGFGQGRWNGVGGKVESGETIESALIREAQEEISVTPRVYEKVAELRFDEFIKGEPAQMHVHVFIGTSWTGEPVESEEMAPKWFSVDSIPYESMWDDDPYWLPLVLKGKKVAASFKLDKSEIMIDHDVKEVEGF